MHRLLNTAAALSLVCLFARPTTAHAQQTITHINGAAGLAVGTGSFGDRNDAGYSLLIGLGIGQPTSALSFRAEGMYNQFDEKFARETSHATSLTGNLVYELAGGRAAEFVPYVIGGVGIYSTREPDGPLETDSRTNVGWNVGGGVRFPLSGFSVYTEARYHSVGNVDIQMAPIVFGVVF